MGAGGGAGAGTLAPLQPRRRRSFRASLNIEGKVLWESHGRVFEETHTDSVVQGFTGQAWELAQRLPRKFFSKTKLWPLLLRWFRLITTANTNVSLRLFFITNYCLLMASFCLPWLFIVSPTQVRLKWMTCFKIIQHKNRRDLKFLLWQVQFGCHGCWLSWLRSENSKDVLIPFLTLLVEIRSKKTRPILWNYSEIVNVWHLMTVNDLTLTCRGMEDYCSPLSFIQEKIKPNKMKKKAS